MSNFEWFLQEIADDISSPNDAVDNSDFVDVKDYVLDIMRRQDWFFDEICGNDILFGSMAHNIRLYNDNEYDVLMELWFPDHAHIKQVPAEQHPGFAYLDFSQANYNKRMDDDFLSKQQKYLKFTTLKTWMHNIFLAALENFGNVVDTSYDAFTLKYSWRGITYTIYAESSTRKFSIDFVPAVKIVRPNSKTWHAIPKFLSAPGNTGHFTCMISNAQSELHHVSLCGQTLANALRLLQALRNSKQLPKLRCYHFVTVAIWLARRIGHSEIANMPLESLFILLLQELLDAFISGHLAYLWDSQMNLLKGLTPQEKSLYTSNLSAAYNTLKSYPNQATLRYGRCLAHFQ